MKNNFLTSISGGLMLLLLSFSFLACESDQDPIYEGYGMVNKLGDDNFSVILDDGNLIYPREYSVNPSTLNDSTRLYMQFNIMEESDSCAYVRITYADTILTKYILPYKESILDSVGKDPVKITRSWFAHGFLNFEFMFSGRAYPNGNHAHMVNLLQCASEGNKLFFEFRHNAFNDYQEKVFIGVVSFPIAKLVEPLEKPVKMEVKFHDSRNTSRSIELVYR